MEPPRPEESTGESAMEMFYRQDMSGAAATTDQYTWDERGGRNPAAGGAYHYSCNLLNIWSSMWLWSPSYWSWPQSKATLYSWGWLPHRVPHRWQSFVVDHGMAEEQSFDLLGLQAALSWCNNRKPRWWLWWATASQLKLQFHSQSLRCAQELPRRSLLCRSSPSRYDWDRRLYKWSGDAVAMARRLVIWVASKVNGCMRER